MPEGRGAAGRDLRGVCSEPTKPWAKKRWPKVFGHGQISEPGLQYQGSPALDVVQTAGKKLTEPHHGFDDAEDRLHALFVRRIRCPVAVGLEAVRRVSGIAKPNGDGGEHASPRSTDRPQLLAGSDIVRVARAGIGQALVGLVQGSGLRLYPLQHWLPCPWIWPIMS